MTEKLKLHEFKPTKSNPFTCEHCPFLRGNPVHRKIIGQMIRGTAHPNKIG